MTTQLDRETKHQWNEREGIWKEGRREEEGEGKRLNSLHN